MKLLHWCGRYQSAIQELMLKEHLDVKPNLEVLPTLEDHDIRGYKFNLKIGNNRKTKKAWMYSLNRNKIYIRMNEIFTVDAVYTPKLPLQQLRIRVLMCFKNEVSEPVLRCQNHLSKDPESHQKRRCSLLRCENPSAEYCGIPEGKSINDRQSILIPLGLCALPKDGNSIAQTIAIKFTCQNSCIGRKETSIIFILEGMCGEILSQRVLDVKICSCPKRDYEADERNNSALKRKSNEDVHCRESKLMKNEFRKLATIIKHEDTSSDFENSDSSISTTEDFEVQPTPSGSYRLTVELANKELAHRALEYCRQLILVKVIEEPQHATRYSKNYRQIKRLRDKLQKI